jgi:hypothetical protein
MFFFRKKIFQGENWPAAKLKSEINSLPDISRYLSGSSADEEWNERRHALRRLFLEGNLERFLTWDMITETMFVGNDPYIKQELKSLKMRPEWTSRWAPAILEEPIGSPKKCKYYKGSSGNRIHTTSHIAHFEEWTGIRIADIQSVIEFGGGYGCMCHQIHKFGFCGNYIIIDFPELNALQKYYLRSLSVDVVEDLDMLSNVNKKGVYCISDIEVLSKFNYAMSGGNLFIATWSISETGTNFREHLLSFPVIAQADYYLITYQTVFGDVDNINFFNEWCSWQKNVTWTNFEVPHRPGSYYLFGKQ